MLCSNQRLLRVGIAGKSVHNMCIDACYDSREMLADLRVLSLAGTHSILRKTCSAEQCY